MRYVALPVNLETLDPDRLARFQFELAAPEARPLFFFDADGSRAGALWYIRRVTVDRVDAQIARREAEEIGLKDPAAWQTGDHLRGAPRGGPGPPRPTRTGAADPATPVRDAASSASPRTAEKPSRPRPTPTTALPSSGCSGDRPDAAIPRYSRCRSPPPRQHRPAQPAGSFPLQDVVSWRPFAAMLLTGLSLPLAYWTRTAIPDAIARARASLPAPAPRPRSLPHESGE